MDARMERMMSICNRHSLLAKPDPRIEIAADRAQMVKALAEADAVAAEMSRLEKEKRAKQIVETRKALAVQVTEKADRILREKEENDQQAVIWEKQAAEFAASEQAKVDKELIKKIQQGDLGVDPDKIAAEIAMNRPIYE